MFSKIFADVYLECFMSLAQYEGRGKKPGRWRSVTNVSYKAIT